MTKIRPLSIPLLILGTGTFAMEVADLVSDITDPRYTIVGFAASLPPYEPGSTMLGLPVYWVDELGRFDASHRAVCALVSTRRHRFVEQARELGMRFARIIHPTARVSRTASVREGAIISAGVLVASYSEVAEHVVVNRGAILGHHVRIGECATISPGANLAGAVEVGERAYIGMGAQILEKRRIGEGAIIGAGAVVTRDVPARTKVMGVPARVVEEDVSSLYERTSVNAGKGPLDSMGCTESRLGVQACRAKRRRRYGRRSTCPSGYRWTGRCYTSRHRTPGNRCSSRRWKRAGSGLGHPGKKLTWMNLPC